METLRIASLIAAVIGGLGSVVLMLMAGLRPPAFLVALFIVWVLAPFAALAFANMISRRWPIPIRRTLYGLIIAIASIALAIYGFVLVRPPVSQPASPYVAVPLGSWLLVAIILTIAALISRRQSRRD